ncbi:hypothetical protein Godav_011499 [Gossypium davidsonii]|uniref:Uncharacterized protein n=1 Tax=Gossypium davidsonii TaxID=34287 RepID=A0A7J8RA13_GOSDV|nr:hypothetical protein [Gossypium davidsonii]
MAEQVYTEIYCHYHSFLFFSSHLLVFFSFVCRPRKHF